MEDRTKRVVLIVVAVVFVGVVAGMVIPAFYRARGTDHTPAMKRMRNMRMLLSSLRHYATDNGGYYPYSPEGGAAALDDALGEYNATGYLRWDPVQGTVKDQPEHNYLYLNAPPDEMLGPDTIVLVEKAVSQDDGSLCVGTRSGEDVMLHDVKEPPSEVLGRDLNDLLQSE